MSESASQPPQPPSSSTMERGSLPDKRLQQVHAQLAREKGEPREDFAPLPLYLVGIFCVLFFWGGVYLTKFTANFDPFALTEIPGAVVTGPPPAIDPMVLGRRLYTQQCVACHGPDGSGQVGVFPPLVKSDWVLGANAEARLSAILLHGLAGPITVLGNEYNGNMPAFPQWRDEQVAAVLTYIRTNPDWGQTGELVTPEQVAEIRAATAGRSTAWSGPEILAQFPLQ